MKSELLNACDHLLNAGLNGLYQGVLLTLAVACGLRLLGRSNAATRHAAWFITLLLLLALFPAHYYLDQRILPAVPSLVASAPASKAESQLSVSGGRPELWTAPAAGSAGDWPGFAGLEAIGGLPDLESNPAPTDPKSRPQLQAVVSPTPSNRRQGGAQRAGSITPPSSLSPDPVWAWETFLSPVSWNILSGLGLPRETSLVLVAAWLTLAVFRMAVLVARLRQLRILKRTSFPVSAGLDGFLQRLCVKLRVKRRVEVRTSFQQRTPILLGFFHPVVLLPDPGSEPPDPQESEHILRHELAHLRRRDDWANLLQNFIQAAIFFHPGAWWVCRQLSLEREIACDDCVLQLGGGPRTYALTLANVASRIGRSAPRLAPGVSTSKSQLQQRISMILNTRRDTSSCLAKTRLGFIASAAAVFAVVAVYSGPRLVLAQSPPAAPATVAPVAPAAPPATPAPPAGAPLVAASQPVAPSAPEVEPGPKFKYGETEPVPKPPSAAPWIWAPYPKNVPPKPVVDPVVAVGHHPTPRAPGSPFSDGSVEERLDRLERMVKSLMAKQDSNRVGRDFHLKTEEGLNQWEMNLDETKKLARAEAARAGEEAKRGAEEARRAAKEAERLNAERGKRTLGESREASQRQIEALRKARENLSREVEMLDRQIKHLEQERQRLEEHPEQRRSALNGGLLLGENLDGHSLLELRQNNDAEATVELQKK